MFYYKISYHISIYEDEHAANYCLNSVLLQEKGENTKKKIRDVLSKCLSIYCFFIVKVKILLKNNKIKSIKEEKCMIEY